MTQKLRLDKYNTNAALHICNWIYKDEANVVFYNNVFVMQ